MYNSEAFSTLSVRGTTFFTALYEMTAFTKVYTYI